MKASRPREIADCVGHFMKQGDLDGIMTLFHPDCMMVFPQGAEPVFGHEAIREAFVPFAEMRLILHSTVLHELINGDTALLTADWKIETDTGEPMGQGRSTEVAKRNPDGSWVYFIDSPYGRTDSVD